MTSASPRDLLAGPAVVVTVAMAGFVAIVAALLLGPLHPWAPGALDASLATGAAYLAGIAPVWRWREPGTATADPEVRRAA